jgi:pimeloyl-ACP methyl ester carboxylesterase
MPQIELSQGTIQYREEWPPARNGTEEGTRPEDGSAPAVLLIHGVLVDGRVWERLIPVLSEAGIRCIAPDLPLGAHRSAMADDADLTPPGLAELIAELISRLELDDVTLVGNDTGGALCQLVVARHPELIGRLVLTNCDAFENFPPRAFRPVIALLARVPGAVAAVEWLARLRAVRGAAMKPLSNQPVPDKLVKRWIEALRDRHVRRDLVRVLRGISAEDTLAAAKRFDAFRKPVLIAWGTRDSFFALTEAERLAAAFPEGRLERIEGARTFVQFDEPRRLGELIAELLSVPRPHRVATAPHG